MIFNIILYYFTCENPILFFKSSLSELQVPIKIWYFIWVFIILPLNNLYYHVVNIIVIKGDFKDMIFIISFY